MRADFVHPNGFASALCSATNLVIAFSSSRTLRNVQRRGSSSATRSSATGSSSYHQSNNSVMTYLSIGMQTTPTISGPSIYGVALDTSVEIYVLNVATASNPEATVTTYCQRDTNHAGNQSRTSRVRAIAVGAASGACRSCC